MTKQTEEETNITLGFNRRGKSLASKLALAAMVSVYGNLSSPVCREDENKKWSSDDVKRNVLGVLSDD